MKSNIKTVRSYKRLFANFKLASVCTSYILKRLLKRNLKPNQVYKFFKRSALFSKATRANKYISINGNIKIDIYLPPIGTSAYIKAMDKLMVTNKKMPCSTALISITSACRNRCDFCYQKLDTGKDIDIDILTDAVGKLRNHGVSFFTIQGGDPFLRFERLEATVKAIGTSAEIWVNSTGDKITYGRLETLKKLGVSIIMFSLHSDKPDEFNKFLKNRDAWDNMVKGVELCHQAGLGVAFNITLFKKDFYNGKFQRIMEKAKDFGACYVQLIKPKPSGAWISENIGIFTSSDYELIKKLINKYNHKKEFSDYPSIWSQAINESDELFGCIAGGTERIYLNAKGDIQPCEFLNISIGNLNNEDFDTVFNRARRLFNTPCTGALCETCAPNIYREFEEGGHSTLPLDRDTSLELLKTWDRGDKTKFYERIK